ncbi:related to Mig1 protein, induced during biotrophic phase [Ustilago bromivora]|uniref:Related to Mig1 protein, induced during biotrophic phase n=1 Tax=Ustilago bromivora TaxID=307758 RepID=A0A8H8QRM4_9BASI|nr:related to Mig1 protein, induced during biotrophic phase [Ustilago bromivora]
MLGVTFVPAARFVLIIRSKLDFTIKDPTKSFVIKYPELRAELLYFNYDPHTGCKDITLKRGGDEAWRIWVSDEDGNGRGIDTKNYAETTKRLCSKWIHIHVKRDG